MCTRRSDVEKTPLQTKHLFAILLLVAGMAIASTGLAGLFAVVAAHTLDWSWGGVYFETYGTEINGTKIPDGLSQALTFAVLAVLPVLVTCVGVALIALSWRGCRPICVPHTVAARRS
jgi:hypothetical protein